MTQTIHLVRHGEVENPMGVIYGRLPGYHLSARGQRQAAAAAARLATRDVGTIWASPLERAQETAAAIAEKHDLEIITDERLIESDSTLEGLGRRARDFARSPRYWWRFRNPLRPSWGESFVDIRLRMLSAIKEASSRSGGREVVIVSHQTPVLVARLALTKKRLPPWIGVTPCTTGSITTMELNEGQVISASYFAPPA
jgi:broad specificity phosphatase PhoE